MRPIDMTITVQHTPEVTRAQNNENTRPEVAQQQFADRINREVQQRDQQVTQTNKPEEDRVDKDGGGNAGGGFAGRKKREKKEAPKSKQPVKINDGSMFDVSI